MGERAPAAPPAWVMRLPLPPGAWRVMVGLWSFADFDADGPQLIGARRSVIAERIGIKPRALRKQLALLVEAGWVRSMPSKRFGALGLELSWGSPLGESGPPGPTETGTGGPEKRHTHAGVAQVDPCPSGPEKRHTWTDEPAQVDRKSGTPGHPDLTGPCKDLADLAERETPAARHQRISRKSAEQRRASKPATQSAPELSAEIIRAVEAADNGAWYPQLNTPTWAQALAEAVDEMALRPAQITRVLEAWTREAEHGLAEGQPDKRGLWWSKGRPWVRSQLRQRGASRAPAHREYVPRTAEEVARG